MLHPNFIWLNIVAIYLQVQFQLYHHISPTYPWLSPFITPTATSRKLYLYDTRKWSEQLNYRIVCSKTTLQKMADFGPISEATTAPPTPSWTPSVLGGAPRICQPFRCSGGHGQRLGWQHAPAPLKAGGTWVLDGWEWWGLVGRFGGFGGKRKFLEHVFWFRFNMVQLLVGVDQLHG